MTSSSGGSSGGKTSGESSGSGGSAVTKKGSGVVSNEQSNYNKRKLRAKSQEIILEVRAKIEYWLIILSISLRIFSISYLSVK